jgi:hypothetical protein
MFRRISFAFVSTVAFTAFALSFAYAASNAPADSIYTDLAANKCKTIKAGGEEAEGPTQVCPGVAGYKLITEEGDLRANIKVVDPKGKQHSLDLWSVVSSAFSTLGQKAEWRVVKKNGKVTPVALIVRYNASENPEDSSKITSYLAVAKITPQKICVTDKIAPSATANEEARRAADSAASKPCLQ